MPDFKNRSSAIEVMDDLNCSGVVVEQTLRELEFINLWLGGNQVTLNGLPKLIPLGTSKEIVIADVGCGGGDMLRLIDRWAKTNHVRVKLLGIDANPNIIQYARNNLKDLPHVEFLCLDIFSNAFRQMQFDIIIGTLFYHHFGHDQLIGFFKHAKDQVRMGMIINDIHRHPLAYYSIKYLTAMFSKSAMVKYDAPLSVLRAFRKKELVTILQESGLRSWQMQWKWAFRWQVVIKK